MRIVFTGTPDTALPSLQRLIDSPRHDVVAVLTRPDAASGRAYRHAQAFRLLVDSQFRQTRRLADYAGALGITQTHLNRISRQVLGTSALGVIERRLALEARRMLLFSTLSIKQIGSHLGYDDPAYFSRFATRMLGRSPSAFRREGGVKGH